MCMKLLYRTDIVDNLGQAELYEITSYPDTISVSERVDSLYLATYKPHYNNGKCNGRHATNQLVQPDRKYDFSKKTKENLLLVFITQESYYEPLRRYIY